MLQPLTRKISHSNIFGFFCVSLFFLLFIGLPLNEASARQAYLYDPKTTVLTGTLTKHIWPGAPNYESTKEDAIESGWVLNLRVPIDINGRANDQLNVSENNIKEIQLILPNSELMKRADKYANMHTIAEVEGTLVHGHTGHHHTTILMDVIDIRSAE